MEGYAFLHKLEASDRAVLLFHGMTGSPAELLPLARALYKSGFDVYCPVLPGHMKGLREIMAVTHDEWIEFSRREFDRLNKTYYHISLGGICVGAVLALHLATERPTDSVLCLSPTFDADGWDMPAWVRPFIWFAGLTPLKYFLVFRDTKSFGVKNEQIRAQIGAAMNKAGSGLDGFPLICVQQMHRLARRLRARVDAVKVPTLIIHSEEDDVADIASAKWLYQHLGAAKKEFIAVQNCYHLITIDNERAAVIEKSIEFVNKQAPGSAECSTG